ncbi:MAG: hypothetical protein AAFN50_05665, partial [Pseudomonadota bacterium]
IYKCWYSPFIIGDSSKGMTIAERKEQEYGKHFREMGICYATSEDGIHWDKPELGLVEYDGSTANNLVWRADRSVEPGKWKQNWGGPHGTGIFKDTQDPDPARRYKAILKQKLLSVAFSADGIHWGPAIHCPEANSHGDTHNNAFWAPTLGKYVAITRQWKNISEKWETKEGPYIRLVARTTSDDFLNWEPIEIVLEGTDDNQQIYAMPVFYHAGVYLGLAAIHDQETDIVWTELTWSPDTETWHRVQPGTPLIGNDGVEGDYDWGCVYAAANPVFLDDEIRLYYGGSDGLHTSWRNGFFCVASLRPDGFAGYKSADGSVTTTPIYNGNIDLRISADVAHGGHLIVQILGVSDQVLAESEPLTSAVTDRVVNWGDTSKLGELGGAPARLKFMMKDATVYSFVSG